MQVMYYYFRQSSVHVKKKACLWSLLKKEFTAVTKAEIVEKFYPASAENIENDAFCLRFGRYRYNGTAS